MPEDDTIGEALRAMQQHLEGDDDPAMAELCGLVNQAAEEHATVAAELDRLRAPLPEVDAEDMWTDYRAERGAMFTQEREAFFAGVEAARRTRAPHSAPDASPEALAHARREADSVYKVNRGLGAEIAELRTKNAVLEAHLAAVDASRPGLSVEAAQRWGEMVAAKLDKDVDYEAILAVEAMRLTRGITDAENAAAIVAAAEAPIGAPAHDDGPQADRAALLALADKWVRSGEACDRREEDGTGDVYRDAAKMLRSALGVPKQPAPPPYTGPWPLCVDCVTEPGMPPAKRLPGLDKTCARCGAGGLTWAPKDAADLPEAPIGAPREEADLAAIRAAVDALDATIRHAEMPPASREAIAGFVGALRRTVGDLPEIQSTATDAAIDEAVAQAKGAPVGALHVADPARVGDDPVYVCGRCSRVVVQRPDEDAPERCPACGAPPCESCVRCVPGTTCPRPLPLPRVADDAQAKAAVDNVLAATGQRRSGSRRAPPTSPSGSTPPAPDQVLRAMLRAYEDAGLAAFVEEHTATDAEARHAAQRRGFALGRAYHHLRFELAWQMVRPAPPFAESFDGVDELRADYEARLSGARPLHAPPRGAS